MEESVKKYSDNPFLYEARNGVEYTYITYKELHEKSKQLAAGLIDIGVSFEDRIALQSEGIKSRIISVLAALHAGAICVPLSVKLESEGDISFRINHSETSVVIASDQQIAKIRPMKKSFNMVTKYILLDPEDNIEPDELLFDDILNRGKELLAQDPNFLNE